MHTVKFLTILVDQHQIMAYALIFLGLIFEGEIVVISAGILSHLGALNVWFTLLFIVLGAFTKTFLCYYIGTVIHDKWSENNFLKYIERRVFFIMPHFTQRPFWSVFISKFIIGTNYMVAIFSGYKRINYKTYLKAEIIGTLIWAPALLSLGYFFSYTALQISREISRFSLVILILMILFFLFDKLVGWFYKIFEEFYDK
jgi:membrane protein DedA with SNARE-associated domain